MLTILTCLALDHDYRFLAAAIFVCLLGSVITMRLFGRMRRASGWQRLHWLSMNAIVGGSTIWTTHFVAMLGYRSDVLTGYEPQLTLASLVIAVTATGAAFAIAALPGKGVLVEAGGALCGMGIIAMHYTGISAYLVQGRIEWDQRYVIASIMAGAVFGAIATSRVARPVTRFCHYGGALALILAIVLAHFLGIAAMTIVPEPLAAVPPHALHGGPIMVVIVATTIVILVLGISTYAIDQQTNEDAVARYRHMSMHDALTGLLNRAGLNEKLVAAVARSDADGSKIAILSFGLDRFKEVNDVHGHAAGDLVLRGVAERLGAVLGGGDLAARTGGDEFLLIHVGHFHKSEVAKLASEVVRAVNLPVLWEGRQLAVGASIGIAVYPGDSADINALIARADVAMHRAKALGSNNLCFYDRSMHEAARERSALAMDMRASLRKGEFELFYQVQTDLETNLIGGFEALLRWRHPRRGMISPAEFIPIAEKTGFILELGDWALVEACHAAARWKQPLRVAVNVAPPQLADDKFALRVLQILNETGLAPWRLELEITESGIIADQQRALAVIRHLKTLGVKIAMDDYGTGYSSLSTLQLFPFDKIKIDRGFIQGLPANRHSAAIVRSTLILAASLDTPVLAEGVENEEHVEFLRAEGCKQAQGFHYGKPMPHHAIDAIVNSDGPPPYWQSRRDAEGQDRLVEFVLAREHALRASG